jgi:hypothetical protein
MMRKDGVAGTGVNEETPTGKLVRDVNQRARGDGVEAPLDTQFPQLQGDSHFWLCPPPPKKKY